MKLSTLIGQAEVNPLNGKATTLPILNPFTDKYSRNFHLSWLSFFIAFFSWFGFPPLLSIIQADLGLTQTDVLNSNILGLTSTLIVRAFSGVLCDKYGPRYVMVGLLLAGAIPTAFVWAIKDVAGLFAIRFFIGILGGCFVPCQVWTTAFFDKKIVGTANALAGGWGNAGGGAVFYVLPAIVQSLQINQHLTLSQSWRVSFLVAPLVLIVSVAILVLVAGEDCPQGKWADRHTIDTFSTETLLKPRFEKPESTNTFVIDSDVEESKIVVVRELEPDMVDTHLSTWKILTSPQNLLVVFPYFCTFGAEIAVEGVISGIYLAQSKSSGLKWGATTAGQWASLFGLLNFVTRAMGGVIADLLYKNRTVEVKKWWLLALGLMEGIFFVIIGVTPNVSVFGLIGLMTGLAIAMEMVNSWFNVRQMVLIMLLFLIYILKRMAWSQAW